MYANNREQNENWEEKKEPEEETVTEEATEDTVLSVTRTKCKHQSDNRGFTEREFKLQYLLLGESGARALGLRQPRQLAGQPRRGSCREGIDAGEVLHQSLRERPAEGVGGSSGVVRELPQGGRVTGRLWTSPWDLGVFVTACILRVTFSLQGKEREAPKLKLWWNQRNKSPLATCLTYPVRAAYL